MTATRLSTREAELLRLVAEGFSNEGIAAELFIGVKTVESTIRSLYVKIGLTEETRFENRRVKAAVYYVSQAEARTGQPASPSSVSDGGLSADHLRAVLDRWDLVMLVREAPYDTIVSVLEDRASTEPNVRWALLAAAAWNAAIRDDLDSALRLANTAADAVRVPGALHAEHCVVVLIDALVAVLEAFTGRGSVRDPRILRLSEVVLGRSPQPVGAELIEVVAPFLEVGNWFVFADLHDAAAKMLEYGINGAAACVGPETAPGTGGPPSTRGCSSHVEEATRCCLAELEVRRARWTRVDQYLAPVLWSEGHSGGAGYGHVLAARVAAGRGQFRRASDHLGCARADATRRNDISTLWRADAAEAFLHLSAGDPEAAVRLLQPLVGATNRSGLRLPSVRMWDGDLIEALLAVQDLTTATSLVELLDTDVTATCSQWGHALVLRAHAMLSGDARSARRLACRSAELFESIGTPFEAARSLSVRRATPIEEEFCSYESADDARMRRAASMFDVIGAQPWADRAGAGLARRLEHS